MENLEEAKRLLKDAESCLSTAKNNLSLKEWRVVSQYSQLAVELSAKAIIACFEEPRWTHDPSEELDEIVQTHKHEIVRLLGEDMIERLAHLSEEVEQAAPWHGWSTYGKRTKKGIVPALELCTEELSKELLEKAERALQTASDLLERWEREER